MATGGLLKFDRATLPHYHFLCNRHATWGPPPPHPEPPVNLFELEASQIKGDRK